MRYEFAGIVVIPGTNCERRVKGGRVYTMYVCMYRRDPPFCRPLMVEVWFDLRRGGQICLPRITQPEAPAQLILHRLGWSLPEQPPPRIYRDQNQFVGTT